MSLKVTDLYKTYSQGDTKLEILKGLSLNIKSGETVAIIGKSGSGKSTLLSLLAGLDKPTKGHIDIGGTKIENLDQNQLSQWRGKNLGIVFQQFHLLAHLTAFENIYFPLEIAGTGNKSLVDSLLHDLGLSSRSNHLPAALSGGECQRIAIARALVTKPTLLLADEPSGNLDEDTGEQVMQAFFKQIKKSGTTTILVTHNKELADRCDRKLLLKDGILQE